MMLEDKKTNDDMYEVKFDIVTPLHEKTGIPKERIALFLADEFIKILGI